MPLVIRFATSDDAELIADLSRETFTQTFAAANTKENIEKFMNEQFTREALMKEVGRSGNIFLLAQEGEVPVGYARMRESENPPELAGENAIEIARIYAVNSFIGTGVGSRLMQKCLDIAKKMNKTVIWLGVWQMNSRAISFYKRWGFEMFGEHDFTLGNDVQKDWLMKKTLNPS